MKHLSALALLFALPASMATAQYCSPSFASGCALWRNQSVNIGTLHWTGTDCSAYDHTSMSATVDPGVAVPMTVSSGNWTGCAVWVDLDNSGSFETSENLYHSYVGGDPSYLYSFNITIPAGTVSGPHRMRVVAGWGTSGFGNEANGSGPCGDYQYGNFDDFTLIVSGTTGVADIDASTEVAVAPNPTDGLVRLTTDGTWQRVLVRSADGRLVQEVPVAAQAGTLEIDLGAEPSGIYLLECSSATAVRTLRVVKR